MQGDLYFWYGTGSVFDKIISWWTRSPFVHVSIDIGDGQQVEAIGCGVVQDPVPLVFDRERERWSYSKNVKDSDPADMATAIKWLVGDGTPHSGMIGKPYGYSDIHTAFMHPFNSHFYVVQPFHYDCSALATEFLVKAGGVDLKGLDEDIHTVTPAKLAQVLGVKG